MLLRKIRVFLSTYYAYMLEYRAELLFWALSGTIPFIMMGIWMEASASGQFGLSAVEFGRYFLATFVVRQFNVVWVIWDFERTVVQGTLSPKLLQPIDPVWHNFFGHLAERGARFPILVGLVLLFFALYPQAFWVPSLPDVLWAIAATVVAFVLRFLIQYTFALFAFWVERATAIEQVWFLLYLFLSGTVAPLTLFPEKLRAIVELTPFPYLIYFPASLLVGFETNIPRSFTVMAVWLVAFAILNRWLWRQGLKHYSGMGA